tara:strand:- start:82 stop:306 length:225 start_codon:yes stop_codon:yes gene_type:complete
MLQLAIVVDAHVEHFLDADARFIFLSLSSLGSINVHQQHFFALCVSLSPSPSSMVFRILQIGPSTFRHVIVRRL